MTFFTAIISMGIIVVVLLVVFYEPEDDSVQPTATTSIGAQPASTGPRIDVRRIPSTTELGRAVALRVDIQDTVDGLAAAELLINGNLVLSPQLLFGQQQAQLNFAWVPGRLGSNRIIIEAFSANEDIEPTQTQVIVNVIEAADTEPDEVEGIEVAIFEGDDPFALALDYGLCPDELVAANPELAQVQPGDEIFIPSVGGLSAITIQECEDRDLANTQIVNFFNNTSLGIVRVDLNAPYPINPIYNITNGRGFECSAFYTGVDGANRGCPPDKPWFHTGIDIGADEGAPLFSVSDGVVAWAGSFKEWQAVVNGRPDYTDDCNTIAGSQPPHEGYGNMVIIERGDISFFYAHLHDFRVERGDVIDGPGFVIGTVGSTGCSTAPHLHFEVRIDNRTIDPVEYLDGLDN